LKLEKKGLAARSAAHTLVVVAFWLGLPALVRRQHACGLCGRFSSERDTKGRSSMKRMFSY